MSRLRTLVLTITLMLGLSGLAQDWARYDVYAAANDTVTCPPKVVFMGNSITQMWLEGHPEWFVEHHFAPRGIGGQTSAQMLCRFRADVIDLHPEKVFILAGTNDIAGNNGPISLPHVVDNILSMCQLAMANGIQPYVCSILPTNRFYWAPQVQPADSVVALNRLMAEMTAYYGIPFVNAYDYFVDPATLGMKEEFTIDGVHLNAAGYDVLEAIALEALSMPLPKASVRLSFDDGLLEHYTLVWPLLKRYDLTASFFIISSHADEGTLEMGAKPMTWKMIAKMSKQGQTIACHTHSHPDMSQLSAIQVADEINLCRESIRRHTGTYPTSFAYPYHRIPALESAECGADVFIDIRGEHISVGGNEYPTADDVRLLMADIVARKQRVNMVIHGITQGWDAWPDTEPFETLIRLLADYQEQGLLTVENYADRVVF